MHDDVPAAEAGWYAQARYQGARISADDQPGPAEAADALSRRILTGAKCKHCGRLVALSGAGATVFPSATLADGTRWTAEEAAAAGQCRWTRHGPRWVSGCKDQPPPATRRAQPKRRKHR